MGQAEGWSTWEGGASRGMVHMGGWGKQRDGPHGRVGQAEGWGNGVVRILVGHATKLIKCQCKQIRNAELLP